jgi:hypothetical protein
MAKRGKHLILGFAETARIAFGMGLHQLFNREAADFRICHIRCKTLSHRTAAKCLSFGRNFCQQPLRSTVARTSPSISAVSHSPSEFSQDKQFQESPPLEYPLTNAPHLFHYIAPRCLSNAILKSLSANGFSFLNSCLRKLRTSLFNGLAQSALDNGLTQGATDTS